jgi:hypothetical protein
MSSLRKRNYLVSERLSGIKRSENSYASLPLNYVPFYSHTQLCLIGSYMFRRETACPNSGIASQHSKQNKMAAQTCAVRFPEK